MTSKTASSSVADEAGTKLSPSGFPVKEVPGGYGVPFFSPLKDRLDYYYLQGAEEYFRSRIARNGGATVVRVNMPPGPFITRDSGVVALLDARSFAVLLDDAKVDKTDTLDGTFMPSLKLFGGYRPLAFLDAADPRHAAIKGVVIRLAVARMHQVAPTFNASFGAMFDAVDASIDSGPVQFNKLNQHHMFDFTCCALFGGTPPSKAMGDGAVTKAVKWLLLQLHPIASKVIKPWPLEDLLLHTFRLPFFLVRRDYAHSRPTSPRPPPPSSTTPRRHRPASRATSSSTTSSSSPSSTPTEASRSSCRTWSSGWPAPARPCTPGSPRRSAPPFPTVARSPCPTSTRCRW